MKKIQDKPGGRPAKKRTDKQKKVVSTKLTELQYYAIARIEHCPHMGTKTFCSACPSHCYRPAMREKIREVMRWSGPRMIRYRPITAVRHAMVTVQAKRAAARSK